MKRQERIERHAQLAMRPHLRDDELLESIVFGHGAQQASESETNPFFGPSTDMHLVVTSHRLHLVELSQKFPAKGAIDIEPAAIVTNRVRLLDETIWFPRTAEDIDNTLFINPKIDVNGWTFHPAKRGHVLSPTTTY